MDLLLIGGKGDCPHGLLVLTDYHIGVLVLMMDADLLEVVVMGLGIFSILEGLDSEIMSV